ncbi:hypothetical protein VCHC33A2_2757, partial [Vibrio cholerae HC-33A2]
MTAISNCPCAISGTGSGSQVMAFG